VCFFYAKNNILKEYRKHMPGKKTTAAQTAIATAAETNPTVEKTATTKTKTPKAKTEAVKAESVVTAAPSTVAEPVVAVTPSTVAEPVVAAAPSPVSAKSQTVSKKTATKKSKKTEEDVSATESVAAEPVAVVAEPVAVTAESVVATTGGSKKAVKKAATKKVKKVAQKATVADDASVATVGTTMTNASTTSVMSIMEDGERSHGNTRFFKVKTDGRAPYGRFSGTKPKQAANKALTSILKTREKDGLGVDGQICFSIVECTRGSKHKPYHYIGERVELPNPMKVPIGKGDNAKEIVYRFNNHVMKDKGKNDA
jgi:hypothetical protein